jgi:hypothetical protein
MNEMTWATVQQWERLHHECDNPRLSRFIGRPHDLSPLGSFLLSPINWAVTDHTHLFRSSTACSLALEIAAGWLTAL